MGLLPLGAVPLTEGTGEPSDSGYTTLVANYGAFAAMKSDGSITAWGSSSYGGTGEPTGSGYTKIMTTVWNYNFLALKKDGSLTYWGSPILPLQFTYPLLSFLREQKVPLFQKRNILPSWFSRQTSLDFS